MAHLASGAVGLLAGGGTVLVTSSSQEVAPVETYITAEPRALLAALAPMSEVRSILTTDTPRPQVHQVLAQAELARVRVPAERVGATGLTGNGVLFAVKRMDVSGVPPRGRPV